MPLTEWEKLYAELEQTLNETSLQEEKLIKRTEKCVQVCEEYLVRLEKLVFRNEFKSQEEEIRFFKHIKPKFAAKLFYHIYLFNLDYKRPRNQHKIEKKYLLGQLKKINEFFEENTEFYKYYKTDRSYLDDRYFVRGVKDVQLLLDTRVYYFNSEFTTSHGHLVASILAYEMLLHYIEKEIRKLDTKTLTVDTSPTTQLNWTESKVALTELLYALHATGAINNGNAELNEIALAFEAIFNVELNNYYRTYLEIRMRKTHKTKFMDLLKEKLGKRMAQDDER